MHAAIPQHINKSAESRQVYTIQLSCKSACRLLPSTLTICLLLLSLKNTHFYTPPIQGGRLSNLSIAVRVLMFVILYYMLIIYNTIYKQ